MGVMISGTLDLMVIAMVEWVEEWETEETIGVETISKEVGLIFFNSFAAMDF